MYFVIDQIMPIMLNEKEHYLILHECSSIKSAKKWIQSKKIEKNTYKIVARSSNGRTHDSDSCYRGSNPCLAANTI